MNSTRFVSSLLLLLTLAMIVSGCELTAASQGEQIANRETILAGTPSPTPTPTFTPTLPPTSTPTNTVGPTPTATDTPIPSNTPLPPTPTANPALVGFSLCDQQAGATSGRFSAALSDVNATGFPAYEQLTLEFDLAPGSAPLGAQASCLNAETIFRTGLNPDPPTYTLRVDLPGWLRDDRFRSTLVSETIALSTTRTIVDARWAADPAAASGGTLLIGLREPLPYRISVERNPTRLVIAVARSSSLVSTSDPLSLPAGGDPDLAEPLFTLFDGDIWRVDASASADTPGVEAGLAGMVNLTDSPETETAFSVSTDGTTIAFCRSAPGLDPVDAGLPVPGDLWLIDADGDNPRPLAQVGVACSDPAFSPDGAQVAFAVDETGALPTQRTIYTVSTSGGSAERAIAGNDEWSRFAPQWLANDNLVFAADAQDGRSTLFLRRANGEVIDLGATLLVDDQLNARYRTITPPLANRDGSRFAVSALRADSVGADLIVLDADGDIVEIIGEQQVTLPTPTATAQPTATATRTATVTATATDGTPEATPTVDADATATAEATTPTNTPTVTTTPQPEPDPQPLRRGPYWSRALAWTDDGELLYLSTLCSSTVIQDYQIMRWRGPQRSELLLAGQHLGAIAAASAIGDGLAYVLVDNSGDGARGPFDPAPRSSATLWLWDIVDGDRGVLLEAERGLLDVLR